jgi:hypothetical protein
MIREVLIGAAAGVAGTAAMTILMKPGLGAKLPPDQAPAARGSPAVLFFPDPVAAPSYRSPFPSGYPSLKTRDWHSGAESGNLECIPTPARRKT